MNPEARRIVIFFSRGCAFDVVGACLKTVREFGTEPIWYHGIPPPEPPSTNSVVLEAIGDVGSASIVIVVSTEVPITPDWLEIPVARRVKQGASFFEFCFSVENVNTADDARQRQAPIATSLEELQELFRSAIA